MEQLTVLEHYSDIAIVMFGESDRKRANHHARKCRMTFNGYSEGGRYIMVIMPKVEKSEQSPFIIDEWTESWLLFQRSLLGVNIAYAVAVFKRQKVWNVKASKVPKQETI